MRTVFGIFLAAAIAFCAWWFVGAHLFRSGVEDWFAAQTEAGRMAEVQDLEVTGFPARFRIASGPVTVMDPESGWGWQAPSAEVTMPAWWPLRVDFALPPQQVLETPTGQVDLRLDGAGGTFQLSTSLAPVAGQVKAGPFAASMAEGRLTGNSIALRSDREDGTLHHLTIKADGLELKANDIRLQEGAFDAVADVTLAEVVDDLADGVAVPIDRIVLHRAELRFDRAVLSITGDLVADGRGFAAGDLKLHVENWPAILQPAVDAGLIPANRLDMLENGLRMMGGNDEVLEFPLTVEGGMVRFGPLPVATAPRFR
ncbi:DUF2125 domain-containing protein [Falsirhodobacter deserti]|uniref:DUF2125 domain-containing protein n=1 Tax=Falsirhodobacter deserti TaxID=1365611 RepID=UPI000FE2AFE8|nr:DUF2125 domain-containing protein [Falsirhodobacter deserti]